MVFTTQDGRPLTAARLIIPIIERAINMGFGALVFYGVGAPPWGILLGAVLCAEHNKVIGLKAK